MSNQKPIYLMAGGRGSRTMDATMQAIFKDINKVSFSVAYVGLASEDNRQFYQMISEMITRGNICKMTQVLLCSKKADLNKAKNILQSSDAVFFSGGDVEAGMTISQEKDLNGFFQELFQQGKLFFGASAGSIMLAQKWVRWTDPEDDSTAELFPCLGIAPVICDTHAEEDDWIELKAALRLEKESVKGYGISSGSTLKVFPDGKIEAIGGPVSQFILRQGKVERIADLTPD